VRDNANAGVMITASHNPREYNGLKIVAGDGTEFSRKGEAEVEQIYYAGEFHAAQWNETGSFSSDQTNPSDIHGWDHLKSGCRYHPYYRFDCCSGSGLRSRM